MPPISRRQPGARLASEQSRMVGVRGAEWVSGQVKSPAEKIKESRLKAPKSTSRSRAGGAPPPTAHSKAAKTKSKGSKQGSKQGSKPPQAPGNQSRGAAAEVMGGTGIIPGEALPSDCPPTAL